MCHLLALLACLCVLVPAQAVVVTDDRGVKVEVARAPQRIVSLLPSLTETVCELGACARLVGVDRYSNHPASVRAVAQLGGGIDPSIEAIVGLKPDLVLIAGSSRGIQRLEALGLKVLVLEPRNAADMRRVLELLARVLQGGDAAGIWRRIDAAVSAEAAALSPSQRNSRVYFEASRGPYAAAPESFIGEILQRLGVRNIVPSGMGPFPQISPEFVVRADPDVIMVTEHQAQELAQRPGWSTLRALREGRLCVFTPAQGDVLVRPGPRMAEAAQLMARCIAGRSGVTLK